MTRDEAIEAGARALAEGEWVCSWDNLGAATKRAWRLRAVAVLDAIGWVEPVGYLVGGRAAMVDAYPTLEEARASGWGGAMFALVPVEVDG